MLATHQLISRHHGYAIYLRQPGFEYTPVMLAKIASYIVQGEDGRWMALAFMYSLLLELDGERIDEVRLLEQAIETIQAVINDDAFRPYDQLTFEYQAGGFVEVNAPRWWIPAYYQGHSG